jgi:hypothetical protein
VAAADNKGGEAELVTLQRVRIAGSYWVEGMRRNSEVSNYETTYLADVTAETAVLLFSAPTNRSLPNAGVNSARWPIAW